MRKVLLVLSTTRYSRASVGHALDEARSSLAIGPAELRVLYIIETAELQKVRASLDEDGFLGMRPQREVVDTLAKQHHRTARRRIQQARRKARKLEGLVIRVDEVEGDYAELAIAAANEGADVVFMTRSDTPFITRFLFGSKVERVARMVRGKGGQVVLDDTV